MGAALNDTPGTFAMIDKDKLRVERTRQRRPNEAKIRMITSSWSWIHCGVLIVAVRDGTYFVVDGQHRLLSALQLSDVRQLPCLVFDHDFPGGYI